MTRLVARAASLLTLAAALLPTGGCAVSLFSREAPADERIEHLERRMDAVERALPPKS